MRLSSHCVLAFIVLFLILLLLGTALSVLILFKDVRDFVWDKFQKLLETTVPSIVILWIFNYMYVHFLYSPHINANHQ